jgi:protein-tyrosine sulfotransferase
MTAKSKTGRLAERLLNRRGVSLAKAYRDLIAGSARRFTKKRGGAHNFLFIVGAGRSGNTLMRRMLIERYKIYIPPETYVLSEIADFDIRARGLLWKEFVNLVVSEFEYQPEFDTFGIATLREFAIEAAHWPTEERDVGRLLTRLYQFFAQQREIDAVWVGDKTPMYTLSLERIAELVPGARYVFLVRDGVDVVYSYVERGIYTKASDAAYRWRDSLRQWHKFKKRIDQERWVEIRYEEFVKMPEESIRGIGEKFALPRREAVLNMEGRLGDVEKWRHHSAVLGPLTETSIGKGRKGLTAEEKARIRPIMEKELAALGYDRVG